MNIAYLITAYIDPFQLKRLCDAILFDNGQDKSKVFLHIDKKVDITPFLKIMKGYSNVCFCKNRYFINWGGYNQVLSQRELLRCAFNDKIIFDRFVCISATDYPLWSNLKIVSYFKEHLDIELIGGYDLTTCSNSEQRHKVDIYHYFRDLPVPIRIRRIFSYGSRSLLRTLGIKRKPVVKLSNGKEVHIYTGSDYWSLSRACVNNVLQNLQDESPYIKRLKHTYIPSEIIVNTIVYNSEFAQNAKPLVHDNEMLSDVGLDMLTPLQLIEYKEAIKVWTLSDFDKLVASGKMFCRKTLSGLSDTLIEKIEKELRKE